MKVCIQTGAEPATFSVAQNFCLLVVLIFMYFAEEEHCKPVPIQADHWGSAAQSKKSRLKERLKR